MESSPASRSRLMVSSMLRAADFGDADDLRRREAVQVNLREALLHAAEQVFVPLDLQVGMQAALQQDAGAAQLHRLPHLVVNRFEVEDVAFLRQLALQRAIEGAEGAVLGAEVGVVDVAVDDVGDHAFGMQLAAHRVGFHADADQVIGAIHLERFSFGQRHRRSQPLTTPAIILAFSDSVGKRNRSKHPSRSNSLNWTESGGTMLRRLSL